MHLNFDNTVTAACLTSSALYIKTESSFLYKRLARDLNRARVIPGKHKDILGTDQLDKVINIDQSPIGRTPRSNPATYTGVFDQIRDLFAATADAKAKGYKKVLHHKESVSFF